MKCMSVKRFGTGDHLVITVVGLATVDGRTRTFTKSFTSIVSAIVFAKEDVSSSLLLRFKTRGIFHLDNFKIVYMKIKYM